MVKYRILWLFLIAQQAILSHAAVYSKTLADWCQSDHLIGHPDGLPAHQRFDSTTNKCTQTFKILDLSAADKVCSTKAPFLYTYSFNNITGITCHWVLLRNSGHKGVRVEVAKEEFIHDSVRYGQHGYVRGRVPHHWADALIFAPEPLMNIRSGTLAKADTKKIKPDLPFLCEKDPLPFPTSVKHVITKNYHQVGILQSAQKVDVKRFHKICAGICEDCYAAFEYPSGEKGTFLVPLYRKHSRRDNNTKCEGTRDSNKMKQHFVEYTSEGVEKSADPSKWARSNPSGACADGPRSAVIATKKGWQDAPFFMRARLICTKEKPTQADQCFENSELDANNKCKCKQGYSPIHDFPTDEFKTEKNTYQRDSFCALKCERSNHSVQQGIGCTCEAGYVDVHSISNGFEAEKQLYKTGQFCVETKPCGENMQYNYASNEADKCECRDGYLKPPSNQSATYCVKRVKYGEECGGENSFVDTTNNKCGCKTGYRNILEHWDPTQYFTKTYDVMCRAWTNETCRDATKEIMFQKVSTSTCGCEVYNRFVEAIDVFKGDACNKKSINDMPKPRRKVDCKDIQLYSHFVFVVDSSGSIGKEYWDEKMVPFVANVVDGLIPTQTNISFVWFSSELVTKTIQLPWGYADVKKYLKANAPYLGHHTFTLEAMAEAYAILEKDIHSKHNVIVLISDGVPNNGIHGPRNDYIRETMEYMDVMKEFYNSTMVYTVGIGETLRTVPFQTEFRHIDDPMQRTSIQMTGETVLKHISRKGCYRAICDLNYQAMDKTNATYVQNDWKMEDERYTHVGDFETLEEGKLAELVRGMC